MSWQDKALEEETFKKNQDKRERAREMARSWYRFLTRDPRYAKIHNTWIFAGGDGIVVKYLDTEGNNDGMFYHRNIPYKEGKIPEKIQEYYEKLMAEDWPGQALKMVAATVDRNRLGWITVPMKNSPLEDRAAAETLARQISPPGAPVRLPF